ncbi:unnamed protein product, partial [Polarella glacialis]
CPLCEIQFKGRCKLKLGGSASRSTSPHAQEPPRHASRQHNNNHNNSNQKRTQAVQLRRVPGQLSMTRQHAEQGGRGTRDDADGTSNTNSNNNHHHHHNNNNNDDSNNNNDDANNNKNNKETTTKGGSK